MTSWQLHGLGLLTLSARLPCLATSGRREWDLWTAQSFASSLTYLKRRLLRRATPLLLAGATGCMMTCLLGQLPGAKLSGRVSGVRSLPLQQACRDPLACSTPPPLTLSCCGHLPFTAPHFPPPLDGSEFAYDTTGQEEVWVWCNRFGFHDAANRTLEAVLGYMRSFPNWAWHGGARSGGDLGNNGKWLVNRGGERMLQHYRSGLNQIPLTEAFRANPDDQFLLRTAMGALTGQLGSIDATGAVAMGWHTAPFVQDYDPRSGDYGLGFFGISLEAAAFLVRDALMPNGWACYLCNLRAGATSTAVAFSPTDAYRIRIYLEPLGVSLVLQTGAFAALALDTIARSATITLAPASSAPSSLEGVHAGGTRPFSVFRLLVRKDAIARPGSAFALHDAAGAPCPLVRGAFVAPPNADDASPTIVTLKWEA